MNIIGAESSTGNVSEEEILKMLQGYLSDKDLSTLTAKKIRSSLEEKFSLDLSSYEQVIQQVLERVQAQAPEEVRGGEECGGGVRVTEQPQKQEQQSKPRAKRPRQQRKKQSFLHPKSDDEADEDFNPHQHAKKKSNKK